MGRMPIPINYCAPNLYGEESDSLYLDMNDIVSFLATEKIFWFEY